MFVVYVSCGDRTSPSGFVRTMEYAEIHATKNGQRIKCSVYGQSLVIHPFIASEVCVLAPNLPCRPFNLRGHCYPGCFQTVTSFFESDTEIQICCCQLYVFHVIQFMWDQEVDVGETPVLELPCEWRAVALDLCVITL